MASHQQAQGIDQVAQAISQMEQVTQTTAATAEESAAASEELNAQAESSIDGVRQLESLVTHATSAPVVASRGRGLRLAVGKAVKPTRVERRDQPLAPTGTDGQF